MADKYDELEKRVQEYFDDNDHKDAREPPVAPAPPQMTKEEWNQHQVTHTSYMHGCKHCMAARDVSRTRPRRQHKHFVLDVDRSQDGPVTVSMDYMYFNERPKNEQDS